MLVLVDTNTNNNTNATESFKRYAEIYWPCDQYGSEVQIELLNNRQIFIKFEQICRKISKYLFRRKNDVRSACTEYSLRFQRSDLHKASRRPHSSPETHFDQFIARPRNDRRRLPAAGSLLRRLIRCHGLETRHVALSQHEVGFARDVGRRNSSSGEWKIL